MAAAEGECNYIHTSHYTNILGTATQGNMPTSTKYDHCAPLTMCDRFPAARHDAVTQLDDLGDADNLLRVVALI